LTYTPGDIDNPSVMPSASTPQAVPPLPLLFTGIAGVAGYNALHYFQRRYPGQVIGIRPRRTWQLTGDGIIALDAEDTGWRLSSTIIVSAPSSTASAIAP